MNQRAWWKMSRFLTKRKIQTKCLKTFAKITVVEMIDLLVFVMSVNYSTLSGQVHANQKINAAIYLSGMLDAKNNLFANELNDATEIKSILSWFFYRSSKKMIYHNCNLWINQEHEELCTNFINAKINGQPFLPKDGEDI